METTNITQPREYTEEELRWAIAAEAQEELQQLNPDSLIGWSETGNIPQPNETKKLADLPSQVQEGIRKGLESVARGKSSRWEFTK